MKVEYICENCGKHFASKKDIEIHEKACKAKEDLIKKRDELRKKSENTINELVERHISTFGSFPNITKFTPDTPKKYKGADHDNEDVFISVDPDDLLDLLLEIFRD